MFLKASSTIDPRKLALKYDVNFNSPSPATNDLKLSDKELLILFITRIYNLSKPISVGGGTVPGHMPSLLMYKHVFSKFIQFNPSDSVESLSFTPPTFPPPFSHNITKPLLGGTIINQSNKLALYRYNMMDEFSSNFVKLNLTGNSLNIPTHVHQGLLLDGCQILAMMKFRHIILNDLKKIESPKNVSFKDQLNKMSGETLNLLQVLFNHSFGDMDSKYVTASGSDNDKLTLINFFDPDTIFEYNIDKNSMGQEIGRNYSKNYRDSAIRQLWKINLNPFQNNLLFFKELKNEDLLSVLKDLSVKKSQIINEYAKKIFIKLGGNSENIEFKNAIIGNGSATKGILDYSSIKLSSNESQKTKSIGVNLFSYDYTEAENPIELPKKKDIRTKGYQSLEVDFKNTTLVDKIRKIHLNLFALDSTDNFYLKMRAYRASGEVDPIFKLENVMNAIGIGVGVSQFWEDSSGKEIGYFTPESNDLVITDNSITKIQFYFSQQNNFNDTSPKNIYVYDSGEIILSITSFTEERLANLSLEIDAENLYDEDRFEILSIDKKRLFWPTSDGPEREKALELINYLKSTPGITITPELSGRGIGMLTIPFEYDITTTYPQGAYILYENQLYISLNNGNTGNIPSASGSNWGIPQFVPNQNYDYIQELIPNFIVQSGTIYRLKVTHQSATFNPANWDQVAKLWDNITNYSAGVKVIKNNNLYQAITPTSGSFNEKKWKQISRVEQDPRYLPFSKQDAGVPVGSGNAKDSPLKSEDPSSPSAGSLKDYLYKKLRYSYAEFVINGASIIIKIQSYASPLASRLDQRYVGPPAPFDFNGNTSPINIDRKNFIKDNHTILGRNSASATDFDFGNSGIASYNQVLTALRCLGILDTITCRLKEISNSDSGIIAQMDDLLNASNTKAATAMEYDANGDPTTNINSVKYTDTSSGNFGYKELKWYTTSSEESTSFSSCND